jgi:hypothetical protein
MSDFRALAAVTLSLQDILQTAVNPLGANTRTGRPERPSSGTSGPIVNIFLYQVAPNPQWRNSDLPTRRSDGTIVQRPRTALDLYYLLSFFGDETEQVPELLLGAVVATLTAIPAPLAPTGIVQRPGGPFSPRAELVQAPGPPSYVPIALTLDELSKLWTMFQIPYALSAVYKASAVLIDSAVALPGPVLPVLRPALTVLPTTDQPRIDAIEPTAIDDTPGATFAIRGSGLDAPGTTVRMASPVSGNELTATPTGKGPGELTVALPAGLPIGSIAVRVIRNPPATNLRLDSNAAALVLRPRIEGLPSYAADTPSLPQPAILVPVSPAVLPGQRVELYLDSTALTSPSEPPSGYSVSYQASIESRRLVFSAEGVPAGTYLVRIAIDGATSELQVDRDPASPTFGRYASPTVVVP